MSCTSFLTYSKKQFDILNPRPEDICIKDISWSLCKQNRFIGHSKIPVSIAAHSISVAKCCKKYSKNAYKWGLLHDAHEAYIGDIISPMKAALTKFSKVNPVKEIERKIDYAIKKKFNFYPTKEEEYIVKQADLFVFQKEVEYYVGEGGVDWNFPKLDLKFSPNGISYSTYSGKFERLLEEI